MGSTKQPIPGVRGNASVGNLNFLNVRNACFWHSDRFLVDSLHYSETDTITAKLEGIFGQPSSTPNIFSHPPPPALKYELFLLELIIITRRLLIIRQKFSKFLYGLLPRPSWS